MAKMTAEDEALIQANTHLMIPSDRHKVELLLAEVDRLRKRIVELEPDAEPRCYSCSALKDEECDPDCLCRDCRILRGEP